MSLRRVPNNLPPTKLVGS